MNEKIKNFFYIIGGAIIGFFSALFGIFLHKRGTADRTGKSIEHAKKINSESKGTIEQIKKSIEQSNNSIENSERTIDDIGESNRKLGESIESSRNIFEEIRKQKLD